MRILLAHDDAYDYRIALPNDAIVEANTVIVTPEPIDQIDGERLVLGDFLLIDAAKHRMVPGLELISQTSRWDNPRDSKLLEGMSPLTIDGEERATMASHRPEQDVPIPTS